MDWTVHLKRFAEWMWIWNHFYSLNYRSDYSDLKPSLNVWNSDLQFASSINEEFVGRFTQEVEIKFKIVFSSFFKCCFCFVKNTLNLLNNGTETMKLISIFVFKITNERTDNLCVCRGRRARLIWIRFFWFTTNYFHPIYWLNLIALRTTIDKRASIQLI